MDAVDLKVVAVVLGTIAAFTLVANVIPQVQSDVPEDVAFGADVTAEELVEVGRSLYEGAGGCLACHAESPGARGPNLLTDYQGQGLIGERCADRVSGLDCKAYLYQALVEPQAQMVEGYPPIMPPTDRTMTQAQIWSLVAFLQTAGGDVTVTGADIQTAEAASPDEGGLAAGGGGVAAGPEFATNDGSELVQELCVMCHVLGDAGVALGPPLDGLGARRSPEEIRSAILDPSSVVTPEYQDLVGLMPVNFGERLTATQLEAVVRYLSELR
jgi:mono/diheme cytochrome c family protein